MEFGKISLSLFCITLLNSCAMPKEVTFFRTQTRIIPSGRTNGRPFVFMHIKGASGSLKKTNTY